MIQMLILIDYQQAAQLEIQFRLIFVAMRWRIFVQTFPANSVQLSDPKLYECKYSDFSTQIEKILQSYTWPI